MKKFTLILLCCLPVWLYGQTQLSPEARISVITCGPWQQELYSAFGHSAFRVYDPAHQLDDAYNYGVFDFDQPNFYLNFARGYLYYKLGIYEYPRFENYYIYHNRYVHEQVLNLTQEQKQKLYDYLQWNARPENEHYRYDYFYDNCATKIRDVVVKALGDDVAFNGGHITTHYTIRDLTDLYLVEQPWGDLGIDICLGLPMDKKATPNEYMFLPDYVEAAFDHAVIRQDSSLVPLVAEKKKIYESRAEDPVKGLPHPLYVFGTLALLAVGISLFDLKRQKLSMWFDAILFGVVGLIGLLLFLLWTATDHRAAANNLNILWALPTHLFAVILFVKQPKGLRRYFLLTAILQGVLLLSWPILPQALHVSLIPVVITLGVRAYLQFRLRPA